jgi:hypothetical protein
LGCQQGERVELEDCHKIREEGYLEGIRLIFRVRWPVNVLTNGAMICIELLTFGGEGDCKSRKKFMILEQVMK